MIEVIEHILVNSITYIKEYSKQETLNDKEKGILLGLWIDLDSIKNHLEINKIKTDININKIMNDLQELINKD